MAKVNTASATAGNTAARRRELYAMLGDLPPRDRPISARLVREEPYAGGVLETLELDLNGLEAVPAYFARPPGPGPFPVILYNHAHGGNYALGKDEFVGSRSGMQQPPYAEALLRAGYAALCIDAWVFGARAHRSELETFKRMIWRGQVLWGMMVYDSLRAIDYLATRREVDLSRLATLGTSMGSTMAWWVAALDERVRVCVDICCLSDYQALCDTGGLNGHGIYYFVPSLLNRFTTAQINALIAPRPHLSLAGDKDSLTPPEGLDRIDAELRRVYAEAGAADAWRLLRYDTGHGETPEMRAATLAFLDEWL